MPYLFTALKIAATASLIGATIEWYDFFIYANAAGLVFAELYFGPAGARMAAIVSFASVGISFLFRPLGAILAGKSSVAFPTEPSARYAVVLGLLGGLGGYIAGLALAFAAGPLRKRRPARPVQTPGRNEQAPGGHLLRYRAV